MVKKALMMLGVLAIVGVAGLSLLLPDAVNASGHSATRSFVTETVAAGSELEVTLEVTGLGGFGQVRETLPDGFAFVKSEDVTASGDRQTVAFTILGNDATFQLHRHCPRRSRDPRVLRHRRRLQQGLPARCRRFLYRSHRPGSPLRRKVLLLRICRRRRTGHRDHYRLRLRRSRVHRRNPPPGLLLRLQLPFGRLR